MDISELEDELQVQVQQLTEAVARLDASTITERVMVLLIQQASAGGAKHGYKKITSTDVRRVLAAIRRLPTYCFKPDEDENDG